MENKLCDGCNFRKPFEHRCHGEGCECDEPSCKVKQGRMSHKEHMKIVNDWIKKDKKKK